MLNLRSAQAQKRIAFGYFELSFTDPKAVDIHAVGSAPDSEAAENIGSYFKNFMSYVVRGKTLESMATQQTLSIQMGLGQSESSGLQDPVYDW